METIVNRPTLQDQQVARESLPVLVKAMAQHKSEQERIEFHTNSLSFNVPVKALQLLAVILASMAEGKAISLIPSDSEISTQQAADLLNVSRPHVVKLLEEGAIPFKKVGSHRRLLLEDVLVYATKQKTSRKEQLQFLAQQAQELNLGYE
ncbi:excisionase family DNA-binding protein [Fibrella musci]|uniref:excisionase family DNA-binding protein n=1 Tax=Fibrella musci TaxID=3242485 RepID=UPI0035213FA5